MQNSYLQMMQDTQRLIERANDISANAERVTSMLKQHKTDLAMTRQMVEDRFANIRTVLFEDEKLFAERFDLLQKELNEAIASIEGREAETVKPPEEGHPEPPIEPPPVEAGDSEVTHV